MFPKNHPLRIRLAGRSTGGLLLHLVISAVWVSRVSILSAADSPDHPHVDTKDLGAETCLKCHPTKNQGKFVHTAVGTGCENCHEVASRDNQTTITLRAKGGDLCAKCHEIKKGPALHRPYKAGQCLICHDPHTGDYQAQTRAALGTLCLGCHMLNQPDARVNAGTKVVTILDGRAYDLESWQSAPKIGEGHSDSNMARMASDPTSGKKPGKSAAEVNCLSCHDPHASKAEHLLRTAAESRRAAENPTPGYHNDYTRVAGAARWVAVVPGPFLGGRR